MMRATTLVALLLTATAYWVDSLRPYQPTSSRRCQNPKEEYSEKINTAYWCCSRCPPGSMLKVRCNETADSVCEPCPDGQYTEGWNYRSQCFTCVKCGDDEGLQYLQNCTKHTKSKCVCQPGQYCILGYRDPVCTECQKNTLCPRGSGVSKKGTAESDVRCSPCPHGTFSDVVSYTESCKPHTRCEKAVVERGTAASDTTCDPTAPLPPEMPQSPATETQPDTVRTPASTVTLRSTSTPLVTSTAMRTDASWPPIRPSHHATELPASADVNLVQVVVPIVISCALLIVILAVLWKSKSIYRRAIPSTGSGKLDLFRDTNGNSVIVESMNHKYASDTDLASQAFESHEQQCFVDTQEPRAGLGDAPDEPLAGRKDGVRHESLL